MDAEELTLRPVRPADRERVIELTSEIWGGHDYLPSVFDTWVADPAADFTAAEHDGVLVGIQRLRPIAAHTAFYEGLRVASSYRRRGLARRMLLSALQSARSAGFASIRLVTGDNPPSQGLFESEGFRLLCRAAPWRAGREEGGDPPRIPSPTEARSLGAGLGALEGYAAYGGVNPDWQAPLDVDGEALERLAAAGRVRLGAGGRALAIVQPESERDLNVSFAVGSGGVFQDLLAALRYEADSQDLPGVWMLVAEGHPGIADLRAVGYDSDGDDFHLHVYELRLDS